MHPLEINQASEWNDLIQELPGAHVLQTWQWGQSKLRNGWEPRPFIWKDSDGIPKAAALVLKRELSLGPLKLSVLYCPKGPTLDWSDKELTRPVLDDLQAYAVSQRAIFIKIDPDVVIGTGKPSTETNQDLPEGLEVVVDLEQRHWQFSTDQIQFRNTVLIDLARSEEQILAGMKQKTRYNIRLSERRGVTIRQGSEKDLPMLYQMYATTAVRDNFVIRHEAYYLDLWHSFLQANMAKILIAEFEDKAVAAMIFFHFAGVSRYMFGMSTDAQRELMPNYLLQWEAIRLSKTLGCHSYDMWGAPDEFNEGDSMWGVYRFKEGFNGTTTRHIGAWDYSPRPTYYKLYTHTLPKLLDILRKRGKSENKKRILND